MRLGAELSGAGGGRERPEILITAGITAPWASLSVQQCNHQPSTCNAQVATVSPGVGGGGVERPRQRGEWMQNRWIMFHLAIVLQVMMNPEVKICRVGIDWFIFLFLQRGTGKRRRVVISGISLRRNSFVKTPSLLGELHPFRWNKATFFAEFKPIVSPCSVTVTMAASWRLDSGDALM